MGNWSYRSFCDAVTLSCFPTDVDMQTDLSALNTLPDPSNAAILTKKKEEKIIWLHGPSSSLQRLEINYNGKPFSESTYAKSLPHGIGEL